LSDLDLVVEELSKNKKILNKTIKYHVYALWHNGEIVYIGQSTQLKERIRAHTKNKEFEAYSHVECKSKLEMDVLEADLIIKLQPKYNIQIGNGYVSIRKLREKIRSIDDEYKYNPEFYVRKLKKKVNEAGITIIDFKGISAIKQKDVKKALDYILDD